MLAPTLLDLELAVLVLAQVVFRATELLGLIRHPSADFEANMIESTKVVIRGYGMARHLAAKTKSPSARFLIFSFFWVRVKLPACCLLTTLVLSTVFCMRSVTWTLNQIWRHSLVKRTSYSCTPSCL